MQKAKAKKVVSVQRNNLSFYGYSLKYCVPTEVVGKRIRSAKLYFEHHPVLEYRYDRKKKMDCITFISNEVKELFFSHLSFLSKLNGVPSTPLSFIKKMFYLLEMEQVFVAGKKQNADGIVNVYGKEGSILFTAIVKDFSRVNLDSVVKMYNGTKVEKITDISYFTVS